MATQFDFNARLDLQNSAYSKRKLETVLNKAAVETNKHFISRPVSPFSVKEIFQHSQGIKWTTGGNVLNNKGKTRTSGLGVAWYTEPNGSKVVRVVSRQIPIGKRHGISVFGYLRNQSPKDLVENLVDAN